METWNKLKETWFKPWELKNFKVPKRTLQVIRFIFQNLSRISSWSLKKSSRTFKIHQLYFWRFLSSVEEIEEKQTWTSAQFKLNWISEFFPETPKIQKLIFQKLWRIGQNFKHKSCRPYFNLQVWFWPKLKFSSKSGWIVKLKIVATKHLTEFQFSV